jgi:hypothetical protein
MATVIVFVHEFDEFSFRPPPWIAPRSVYMLFSILRELTAFGHRWRVAKSPRFMPGDAAILHVDSTHVGEDYLSLAQHYRTTLNFGAGCIAKSHVSGAYLGEDMAWDGPVIVKSSLNSRGAPEIAHNMRAARMGRPPPHPHADVMQGYDVLPSLAQVPVAVRDNPNRALERFLPEREGDNFVTRNWIFMGGRERCVRCVSTERIVKGANIVSRGPCDVPEALRAERRRLGFDYGKFDFVMHGDEPLLLDANRTPALPNGVGQAALQRRHHALAAGLHEMIKGQVSV